MGYKCVNCGVIKEDGSKVYFINSFNDMTVRPTCSVKCATEMNDFAIKILQNRIKTIKNTETIAEVWED